MPKYKHTKNDDQQKVAFTPVQHKRLQLLCYSLKYPDFLLHLSIRRLETIEEDNMILVPRVNIADKFKNFLILKPTGATGIELLLDLFSDENNYSVGKFVSAVFLGNADFKDQVSIETW